MICRIICAFLFTIISFSVTSQPGTEIYLFDLKIKRNKIIISNSKNITNHKGYDNQPFFHPDKSVLYFVSANEEGDTDIVEYDYQTGKSKKLTATGDREYSPTVTPDKQFISCILQRDNGAQDLVKYPIAGGEPVVLIPDLIVGYHAWANINQVMVFTLPQPFKLQHIDLTSKTYSVIGEQIGRSLHKVPGKNMISFLQKTEKEEWFVNTFNVDTKKITTLTRALPGPEHHMAWTPDGKMIMSDDTNLYFFIPGESTGWSLVQTEGNSPLTGISRIAVSADGKTLALVVNEPL